MDDLVKRAAKAIDNVQLFTRFNDWTSDRVEGFPVEVCRHGDISKDEIIVVERHPAGWKDLYSVVSRMRARAVVDLVLDEAAKTAKEFGWTLPMFESAELNEATDDAACSAQEQIAAAIRSLSSKGGE